MPKKILIADDEPEMIRFIQSRLESSGYEVITALDGEEALRHAEAKRPDLILLDIKLPRRDGLSVAKTLKKQEDLKNIPIIILSAYREMKDLFAPEGIGDYVTKPFQIEDLVRKIEIKLQTR